MQLMEETHRLTMQQMVVTHSNELENLASKTRELQSELQTKSVSVKFSAVCLLCCSVSRVRKNKKMCCERMDNLQQKVGWCLMKCVQLQILLTLFSVYFG